MFSQNSCLLCRTSQTVDLLCGVMEKIYHEMMPSSCHGYKYSGTSIIQTPISQFSVSSKLVFCPPTLREKYKFQANAPSMILTFWFSKLLVYLPRSLNNWSSTVLSVYLVVQFLLLVLFWGISLFQLMF